MPSHRQRLACLPLLFLLSLPFFFIYCSDSTPPISSSLISLTIYQQNVTMVQEERKITLESGDSEIFEYNFPQTIIPTSLSAEIGGASIIVQRVIFSPTDLGEFLRLHVGQKLTATNTTKQQSVTGILVTIKPTYLIIQNEAGNLFTIPDYQTMRFQFYSETKVKQSAIQQDPTLNLVIRSSRSGGLVPLKINYQIRDLTWEAVYTATLPLKGDQLNLGGMAAINNQTPTTFDNASIQLLGGKVSLIEQNSPYPQPPNPPFMMQRKSVAMMEMNVAPVSASDAQKSFEYYRYSFPIAVTLPAQQLTQLSLFPKRLVSFTKSYHLETPLYFQGKSPITTKIEITNTLAPLPSGLIRFYQESLSGTPLLLGEANMEASALKDKVEIMVGEAFDLSAEEYETENKRIDKNSEEKHYSIVLKNNKADESATIIVTKSIGSNATLLKSSHPHTLLPGHRIQFEVTMTEKKSATLLYQLRFRHD